MVEGVSGALCHPYIRTPERIPVAMADANRRGIKLGQATAGSYNEVHRDGDGGDDGVVGGGGVEQFVRM